MCFEYTAHRNRMGQTQDVVVHRFVVDESVEERMVNKIQARKKFIASSLGMMSDEEKKQVRSRRRVWSWGLG